MAEFSVSPAGLKTQAQAIGKLSGSLSSYSQKTREIAAQIYINSSSGTIIKKTLRELASAMQEERRKVSALSDALEEVAETYENTENRLAGQALPGNEKSLIDSAGGATAWEGGGGQTDSDDEGGLPSWLGAVISRTISRGMEILGVKVEEEESIEILGGSAKADFQSGLKWEETTDKNGNKTRQLKDATLLSASGSAEGHLIKGTVKRKVGYLQNEDELTVGQVSAKGEVKATLIKDGKLNPQVSVGAEASAVGVEKKERVSLGTDNNDVHIAADGKLGYAKASASAGAGKITYTDKDGNEKTGYGVKAEAGAEAYVAQGKVSGGVTILGVKIDVGITGKAGGAGAKAGGAVTTGGVSGSVSVGAGVGLGLDLSIDWSGFKFGW